MRRTPPPGAPNPDAADAAAAAAGAAAGGAAGGAQQQYPALAHLAQILQNLQAQPPQNREISRVSVKPPAFCKEQPDLYFIQMESQFAVAGITVDQTKFHHVVSSLDAKYLQHVGEIIRNPPAANKYEAVKKAIIDEFTDSDQKKVRTLIKEIELGDLKPSQLLKRMKELARDKINDDVMKTLWMERLPESIRAVISIVDGDAAQMALQADKMLEIHRFSGTGVSAVQSTNPLQLEIEALRQEIAVLKAGRPGRMEEKSQNNGHGRSRSKSKVRFPFCRYHYRFGDKAKKCVEPCQYKKLSPSEEN